MEERKWQTGVSLSTILAVLSLRMSQFRTFTATMGSVEAHVVKRTVYIHQTPATAVRRSQDEQRPPAPQRRFIAHQMGRDRLNLTKGTDWSGYFDISFKESRQAVPIGLQFLRHEFQHERLSPFAVNTFPPQQSPRPAHIRRTQISRKPQRDTSLRPRYIAVHNKIRTIRGRVSSSFPRESMPSRLRSSKEAHLPPANL
jgi:hypothetical protein